MARRIAALVPYYEYDESRLFRCDGAPEAVAAAAKAVIAAGSIEKDHYELVSLFEQFHGNAPPEGHPTMWKVWSFVARSENMGHFMA